VESQLDARACFDPADHGEASRIGNRGEQLVVLAEAEVVDVGAGCERDGIEIDHAADAGAAREVAGVDGEPVRDVEHRVGGRAELLALGNPDRRPGEGALAECRAGCAEGAGDHEKVSWPRAGTAGNAL
jgi:hypothetical protein